MPNIKFAKLENKIREKYPKFQYKFKDQDGFMKNIGKVMFFNKNFMSVYTTTIGSTVYFPNKANFDSNPDNYFETLCHEYVHVADDAKHPIFFKFKYLFPQILAAPALLFILLLPILIPLMIFSIISPWWLFTLLTAVFFTPFPSPGRTQAELRGYGMSTKVRVWEGIEMDVSRYVPAFTGSGYYFMCPFEKYVKKELNKYLETDECLKEDCFKDVYDIVKSI